jgi:CNT family concentrative nucleoside transporter
LDRFHRHLGILAVLAAAWLGSTDRKRIRWRTVAWGLGLQFSSPSWCCASTTGSAS